MDWKFLYGLVSFLVGLLAGFQGIHNRFKRDSISVCGTLLGVVYLVTRGLLPAAVFLFIYASGFIERYLFLWAIACGVSAETILRSKFYLKEAEKDGGTIDLIKGPFDLLQWYQNFVLEGAATSLADARKRFVKRTLPHGIGFIVLCDRVVNNLPAYPRDQAITIETVRTHVERLRSTFDEVNAVTSPEQRDKLNKNYCEQLGYVVLNEVGKRGFKTLLVEIEPSEAPIKKLADL